MSKTPGETDGPVGSAGVDPEASSSETPPGDESGPVVTIDLPSMLADDEVEAPAADDELQARDALAAAEVGDGRAEVLMCARALRAEARGDVSGALRLWRTAFDRDPTLLVAYWGLWRGLARQGAWAELVDAIDRRLGALPRADAAAVRADLWYQRARIEADWLHREDDAVRSLRAGLAEPGRHPGLLVSLLLLGFRRADGEACHLALDGLLDPTAVPQVPPALRAEATAWLAASQRLSAGAGSGEEPAARALATVRAGLRAVGPDDSTPLVDELGRLARAGASPATQVAVLGELIAQTDAGGTSPDAAEEVVSLLREQARVLRDELGDQPAATAALSSAVDRSTVAGGPAHPLALAELADLIETDAGAAETLLALLARARSGEAAVADATGELVLRVVAALARGGRHAQALALLENESPALGLVRTRADVFALEVQVRAAQGDTPGLATAFEGLAERLLASGAAPGDGGRDPVVAAAAAGALVAAGALRETIAVAAADAEDETALRHYLRAAELAPDQRAAWASLERRLGTTGRWRELATVLERRIEYLEVAAERRRDPGEAAVRAELARLRDELVAVYRDLLDDPAAALRAQDGALFGPGAEREPVGADTRAWARRLDLAWRVAARTDGPPDPEEAARTVRALQALADDAGEPTVAAALRVAGGRLAAATGDVATAGELFAAAATADLHGSAVAGLERLAAHPAAVGDAGADSARAAAALRAGLIREELARVEERLERGAPDQTRHSAEDSAYLRALRARLAWHALGARRPEAALEALGPARAEGDGVARAWSWEIARQSGDPRLALGLLQAIPDGAAGVPPPDLMRSSVDLGETLERAGDLRGAEAAFQAAHHEHPSADTALGLLRVAVARGHDAKALEATRALTALADASTRPLLAREVEMLGLVRQPAAAAPAPEEDAIAPAPGIDEPADVVLGWARATRSGDPLSAATALLEFGRALPTAASPDADADRTGVLARAAARSRVGGAASAGAIHQEVQALSSGAAPIAVGLSDLPVAGHPDRAAARRARAERCGGTLAYALELERAYDAEARGDAGGALEAFGRALTRDAEGIEALDGIKRIARTTGDRLGAARAGARLGMVLRSPARAAAELAAAAQQWEDLGQWEEATVAFWQALAREPRSPWLFERLRELLVRQDDWAGLDQLLGHRLAALDQPAPRAALLLERARHRLERLDDRGAAIDDLKRTLKVDPEQPEALRLLATLATESGYFRQAVRFLERLLARTGASDGEEATALRLELADAHESAREPGRAVEVLRAAVSARPREAGAWQRLIDLLLRLGDWHAALATLRGWDAVVAEPTAKANVWVRIGTLLRDHAHDPAGAARAFAAAADLDPLSDGLGALVGLDTAAGTAGDREAALARGFTAIRAALQGAPLDIPRLRRLRELHVWSTAAGGTTAADGATVVGQVLALAGDVVNAAATRRPDERVPMSAEFWNRVRAPGAGDLARAMWPHLSAAVSELAPPARLRVPARERVAPGSEPRLAWIEAAAAAVGLPDLELAIARQGSGGTEPGDASVWGLEGSHPTLIVGRGVLAGDATARFRVGRALALLRDRATVLDRVDAGDLGLSFAAGAMLAGAAGSRTDPGVEERARALGKAMSRKDRKALELEASRFGFETVEAAGFHAAVLATADRVGLLFAGDVGASVRLTGEPPIAAGTAPAPAADLGEIQRSPRALALLRFALSPEYLVARRELGHGREQRIVGRG